MACKDTKTGFQGVAWDPVARRPRKTKHFRLATEARDARRDLQESLRRGDAKVATSKLLKLGEGIGPFIKGAKEGVVLNKWRRPYRPRAVDDLESLRKHISPEMARRPTSKVTRGEVQTLVDSPKDFQRPASARSSTVSEPSTAGPRSANMRRTIQPSTFACR
jgi:hypothetical protein